MTTTDSTGLDSETPLLKVKAGMIRLTRRGFTNKVDPGWLRASSIRSLFATQHGSRIFLDDDDWDVAESVEDVLSLMAQAQPLDPSLLSLFLHNLARPEPNRPQPSPAVQHG